MISLRKTRTFVPPMLIHGNARGKYPFTPSNKHPLNNTCRSLRNVLISAVMLRGVINQLHSRTANLIMAVGVFCCSTPVMAAESTPVTAPVQTPEVIATTSDVKHGEAIFNNICILCHRTDYETSPVGAPGLRDVMQRHTPEWEDQWLTSPAAFAKKDETAKALIESNPYGLVMPTFPEMANEQNRRDVIEFLKTLSKE